MTNLNLPHIISLEVFSSFIVGGLTGGILEAPNTAVDFNNNMVEANNNIQQKKATLPVANTNAVNKNSLQTQNNIEGNPLIENKNPKTRATKPVIKNGATALYSFNKRAHTTGITNKIPIYFDIIPKIFKIKLYLIS